MEMNNLETDVRGGIAETGGSRARSARPSGISGRWVKSPPRSIPALFGDSRKMAAAPLYCVCRQPYDVSRFMIECDICKDWFHGRYVGYDVFRGCGSLEATNTGCFSEKSDGSVSGVDW